MYISPSLHIKKKSVWGGGGRQPHVFQAGPRLHVIEGNPELLNSCPYLPSARKVVFVCFYCFCLVFETGSHVTRVGVELVQG